MDRIHKLPFLLGGSMTVITGAISYLCGSDSKTTYIRMVVVMVVFYIIGIYIRNTIQRINVELEEKKLQEQTAFIEEMTVEYEKDIAEGKRTVQNLEHKLDLVADDSGEDFSPLTLSHLISNKTKE